MGQKTSPIGRLNRPISPVISRNIREGAGKVGDRSIEGFLNNRGELSPSHRLVGSKGTVRKSSNDVVFGQLLNERASLLSSVGCEIPCLSPISTAFSYLPASPITASPVIFSNTSTGATSRWSCRRRSFAETSSHHDTECN